MNIKLKGNEVGEVAIGESAVRSVVALAIEGVGDDASRVNRRFLMGSAIRVKESQDKKLVVDVEINMPGDAFLPDAMREVQAAVKAALSRSLGIGNAVVNVTVTKIAAAKASATGLAAADAAVARAAAAGVAVTKAAAGRIAEAGAAVARAADKL